MSGTSVENFLSYSAEKTRRGIFLCFTEFLESKTFLEKRRGGVSGVSVEVFLSHFAGRIRRGTH